MEIELTRTYYPGGTNGELHFKGTLVVYTIELPWRNNEPQRSCIPEGRYRLVPRYSLKHLTHFMLQDVKDRQLILIHPANDAVKELKGCIAPVSKLTGEGQGSASRIALEKLKKLITGKPEAAPVFITIKSKKQ